MDFVSSGNEKKECKCNSTNCSGFLGVRPKTQMAMTEAERKKKAAERRKQRRKEKKEKEKKFPKIRKSSQVVKEKLPELALEISKPTSVISFSMQNCQFLLI